MINKNLCCFAINESKLKKSANLSQILEFTSVLLKKESNQIWQNFNYFSLILGYFQ
jgi:hypothetical protein